MKSKKDDSQPVAVRILGLRSAHSGHTRGQLRSLVGALSRGLDSHPLQKLVGKLAWDKRTGTKVKITGVQSGWGHTSQGYSPDAILLRIKRDSKDWFGSPREQSELRILSPRYQRKSSMSYQKGKRGGLFKKTKKGKKVYKKKGSK